MFFSDQGEFRLNDSKEKSQLKKLYFDYSVANVFATLYKERGCFTVVN